MTRGLQRCCLPAVACSTTPLVLDIDVISRTYQHCLAGVATSQPATNILLSPWFSQAASLGLVEILPSISIFYTLYATDAELQFCFVRQQSRRRSPLRQRPAGMDLNRVTSRNPQYTDTRNLSNPSCIYVRLRFEIGSNSCWQRRVSQLDLANFHALQARRTWSTGHVAIPWQPKFPGVDPEENCRRMRIAGRYDRYTITPHTCLYQPHGGYC